MGLALSIFAVAFAAFCVWLVVRIINRRERWAKGVAIGLVVVLYPLSFGPACWISSHAGASKSVGFIYQPMMQLWWQGQPPRGDDLMDRYTRLAARAGWGMGQVVASGAYDWGPRP
jgi:hypothetical protein